MNIFSRIKNAIAGQFGGRITRHSEMPEVREDRKGNLRFPKFARVFKLCASTGRPHFGPAFIPSREFHHVSRQACRAVLRGIQFFNVSQRHPLMSRRERRRLASLMARLEYRRMMQDTANAIPDEATQLYTKMTQEELGVPA